MSSPVAASKLPPGGYEKNDAIEGCESVDKGL
jgi:hypothetical protein